MKVIATGYRPREHQRILHRSLRRFNVVVCHRRFGKSIFAINEMIDKGLRNPLKFPQYAFFSPTYSQSKRNIWEKLKEYTMHIPGATAHEAELRVDIKRPHLNDHVRLMLLGAENPGSIRGIYLDGAVMDEFAECDPTIWGQVIRPALSDRLGWGIFIGTPKGCNHFYDIYQQAQDKPDWFTAVYKASETKIIPEEELLAAKDTQTDEEYEQEWECSFLAGVVGGFYSKQMTYLENEKRFITVPYDAASPVYTGWDLGTDDSTAIWFYQSAGREFHLIDHVEDNNQELKHYIELVKRRPYAYERHFLPHDAAARELTSNKSRVQHMKDLGLSNVTVVPRANIEDGINETRKFLYKCFIDKDKCERGIEALKNYRKKWDAKLKIFSSNALHDWSSHSADALRTLVMGLKDTRTDRYSKPLPRRAISDYNIFTLKGR